MAFRHVQFIAIGRVILELCEQSKQRVPLCLNEGYCTDVSTSTLVGVLLMIVVVVCS